MVDVILMILDCDQVRVKFIYLCKCLDGVPRGSGEFQISFGMLLLSFYYWCCSHCNSDEMLQMRGLKLWIIS